MKKKLDARSAFFRPRILLALALCLVGVSLAIMSMAGPTPAIQVASTFGPIVSTSVVNGISESVRELPIGLPSARTFVERELPPVKPGRDIAASSKL